jgi:hypothetical protein
MYGRMTHSGIEAIKNHAEAVKRWESIKPIRGRASDERPVGDRRKSHMQIRKNADESVTCVLYSTEVITFYSDNKVRLHVPSVWRTNTSAKFIEDVLGRWRVNTGMKDGDVIVAVKGDDARYLRVGENTIFEVAQGGSLTLLSNDRVHTVFSVNRTEMNALRKTIAPFMKYLMGSIKLREGVFSIEQANELITYLAENQILGETSSAAKDWYMRATWDLSIPTNSWRFRGSSTGNVIAMYREFMHLAINGTPEDWNHLACWVAMSAGIYSSRDEFYRATTAQAKKLVDNMLMALNPSVFVEEEEARDRIQVNRYKNFVPFADFIREQV